MQFLKETTKNRVNLGAGTLYGAINTLEKRGWISKLEVTGEGKKIYIITDNGKAVVHQEIIRLRQILSLANHVIGDDFNEKI